MLRAEVKTLKSKVKELHRILFSIFKAFKTPHLEEIRKRFAKYNVFMDNNLIFQAAESIRFR